MPEQAIHPSPADLRAYGLGQLPHNEASFIEDHIRHCEPCCESIAELSSHDAFVERLQEAERIPTDLNFRPVAAPILDLSRSRDAPAPLSEHPRYEIIGLIGRGGMGNVFEARHRKMERKVALKVINRELVRDGEAVERFHREVRAAAQLSHPNVVTAYDADNAGEYHFMVMEYVAGVDLAHVVNDGGALSVVAACKYIRQAALGLRHAHEQGMIHRDIKPHNLMLATDGSVKILDFGLACLGPEVPATDTWQAHTELTAVGAIMGTPGFISPEQADDARHADVRSDIYSLGATLYHLLAGHPPFRDTDVMNKLKSHTQAEPVRLESLRDDIPAELVKVVARMMAKEPEERFQTAAEVSNALERFVRERPPRRGLLFRPARPVRTRRRLLSLTVVATLLVVLLIAGTVFYLQTGRGTIRVALMDDSLEATIQGEKIRVEDGGTDLEIAAGHQQLVIRQKGTDLEFVTNRFRIWRNDQIKLEVRLMAGEVAVSKDGELFDSKRGGWLAPRTDGGSSEEPASGDKQNGGDASIRGTGKVISFIHQQSVFAPVRGNVRRISEGVAQGVKVRQGDPILEIEADPQVSDTPADGDDSSERRMHVVKAPCDGTLFRLNVQRLGQGLSKGDELFSITPPKPERMVQLSISGDDIPRVEFGDRVRLHFEGWPAADGGTFAGRVMFIRPDDDIGTFRILVREDREGPWPKELYLRPGVRADGWVVP